MRTPNTMPPEQLDPQVAELEAKVRRLESQLSIQASLLDHVHSAVIATDIRGAITHWNRFAEKLYQWREEEVLGKNIMDVTVPDSERQRGREIIAALASTVGHWEGEFRVRRKDGSTFPAWVADSVIRNEKGDVAGYVGVSTDITERKHLENQLREAQKFESLGILAGGVAHDFNNLLVGILGNTSILQEMFSAADPVRLMLNDIVQASERAAELVSQMLAYAGKGRYFLEPVDLSIQAREINAEMRGTVPPNVEVRLELQQIPAIRADVTQIRQIVRNLLINAVEAVGENPGRVTMRTGIESAGYVFLEVHDNGCGMDEATQARIFDPFFSTKFPGRGLGLAAVQGIVRSHKGTLTVHSAGGRGSTFRLLLPVAQ
jgi:two-component system cell cycle sensor histidine kinase/response regulator CckA